MKKPQVWFEATNVFASPTKHRSGVGYYTENIIRNCIELSVDYDFYADFSSDYLKSSYMFLAKWHNTFYVVFCWLLGLLGSSFSLIVFGLLCLIIYRKRKNYLKISNICWKGVLLHLGHPLAIGYYIKR